MKKNNTFLAICSFVACVLSICSMEFGINTLLNIETALAALMQVLFLASFFLCFVLENSIILLFCIIISAAAGFYLEPAVIYTYYPLLMSLWFVRVVETKPRFVELLPYCVSAVLSIAYGSMLVLGKAKGGYSRESLSVTIVVWGLLLIVFALHCVLQLVFKRKSSSAKNAKKWSRQFDNYKVVFYFLEAMILVLSLAFYLNEPSKRLLPAVFAVFKLCSAVYCFIKLYLLGGNEIAVLKKLKKLWKA